MESRPANGRDPDRGRTALVLWGLVVAFGALAVVFALNAWRLPKLLRPIPLVDPSFLSTAPNRRSYADLIRAKDEDALSDFDCYACHEKGKPPTLRFDAQQHLIIPRAHSDIVMGHGEQGRNNNCFNCHDENNLELLQTRDGRAVKFQDSPQLCGSCHGPTYEDWEAGVHGRMSGYWDHRLGSYTRLACVNCHNPHAPTFQGRKPALGPHLLHGDLPPPAAASTD
jgi:formate-dependent nitrite reductase cytochrome c552 subunit